MSILIRSRIQNENFDKTPEEVMRFIIYELKKEIDSLKSQNVSLETNLEQCQFKLDSAEEYLNNKYYCKCDTCLAWHSGDDGETCDICEVHCCEVYSGFYDFIECVNCGNNFCSTHIETKTCPECFNVETDSE